MTKEVAVLGATGSIGRSTMAVMESLDPAFHTAVVTANSNWEELAEIAIKCQPYVAVISDAACEDKLREKLKGYDIEVRSGREGLLYAASFEKADIFITGIVGGIGLESTLEAVRTGKRVGVANKESFVMAGRLITTLRQSTGATIIPVDSEHSAIFQCLQGEQEDSIQKIYITGSGGPFRNLPKERLGSVTPQEALNHPTWNMGPKITVDSATMMNKALEMIEAKWLFNVDSSKIEVIIHPQSIIHSMVEFVDGSVKAQLGVPDMKLPIQYALTYPERMHSAFERLDFMNMGELRFEKPDFDKYPALRIGREALRKKGDAGGIIINAANEVAVELFLKERISFPEISFLIEKAEKEFSTEENLNLEEIIDMDTRVREFLAKELPGDS